MQMAIDVAGFTPGEADQLRQAMGSKRSRAADGAAAGPALRRHGRAGHHRRVADEIFDKMAAFANYGFPESHSVSFAYLVYASVVDQAARAGGVLRRAAQRPADGLLLAALAGAGRPPPRRRGAHARPQRARLAAATLEPCADVAPAAWPCGSGSAPCASLGDDLAEEIAAGRPYADLEDLVRRVPALHAARSSRRWPPRARSAASG